MKLVKIYSNKNFKNIEFKENFNVIIAFIQSKEKKDTHNLGKTSLIRVIDFLLLADIDKNKDKLFGNDIFIGQSFFGEFKLNSGKFLVIKRSIDIPRKISFKINTTKLGKFQTNLIWDKEDLSFKKAKEQLDEYLSFNILNNWPYRQSITYYLRSQQDYLDVFKLNKFKGKHKYWKPFVFDLLGFNGELIKEKLETEEFIDKLKKKLNILEIEAQVDSKEKDRLEGLHEIKTNELEEVKNLINKFNFYKSDLELNKNIVENIDLKLQALNTDRYRIAFEIDKIEKSLSDVLDDIEMENIEELFSEVNLFFPVQLKKKYNELIDFQKSLTIERKQFLKENLSELKQDFTQINKNINELETEKSSLLSVLTEKDSYQKFKEYHKNLTETEVEIERIKDKLKAIDNSLIIEKEIETNKDIVDIKINELKSALKDRKHATINKIFNSIIKEILNTNALISLNINRQGNIEYNADYQNPSDLIKTSEAQGTTYKKLLCVAFDLSTLINYSEKSFYKFVYHDGVLEGLDDRIKVRYINLVKNLCEKYNLQYILTLIDSDIPKDNIDIISDKEICLRLNDKDKNGKLFLNSF
ncbi:MAG: DUF2326 domain-containing protein [Candidatus Marinimicrobia bacterium]|nr:DUF2326 domain-containing protein [Candidatus Neomarinimicrobiota bacterium]